MASISTTFTGLAVSATLQLKEIGEDVTVAISGTYDIEIVLERALTPSADAWERVYPPNRGSSWNTADATVSDVYKTKRKNELLRLRAISRGTTPGSAVTTLSDAELIIHELKDNFGNVLATWRESDSGVGSMTVPGVIAFPDGTAALPAITNDGDLNTGIFFPAADAIGVSAGGSEALRITPALDVIVGNTAILTGAAGELQVSSVTDGGGIAIYMNSTTDTEQGALELYKGANATRASAATIVADNEVLGRISFFGSDGSDFNEAARIHAEVDGTPGDGTDMPGALVFSTSAEASGTPTERMRLSNSGGLVVGDGTITDVDNAVIGIHIHTATAGAVTADTGADGLVIENSAGTGLSILTPDNQTGNIYWGAPSDSLGAFINFGFDAELMRISTNLASGGVIDLETGSSARAIRITATQDVILGHTAAIVGPTSELQVSTVTDRGGIAIFMNSTTDSETGELTFVKGGNATRASIATIVADNEVLGRISFWGSDGTDINEAARIECTVDGAPSDGTDMPGDLAFYTTPDASGTPSERLRISAAGLITFAAGSRQVMDLTTEDQGFIDFNATEDADATSALSSFTTQGAVQGHIQILVNGTSRWITYRLDPSA